MNTDASCPMMAMADLAIVDRRPAPCCDELAPIGSGGDTHDRTPFDAVVVGAGPAGAAAALVLARAGKRVALLERGPFPGSKNMYGGVVYGRVLDHAHPRWWEEVPVQRWVTRRGDDGAHRHPGASPSTSAPRRWGEAPYNGCTTFRPDFDALARRQGRATPARVLIASHRRRPACCATARVASCGVRTDRPDGDLDAPVVIACDGVNSFLAKEAGLYHHAEPEHFTLGVKEVLALPREVIDDRFGLTGDEGADFEILGVHQATSPGGGVPLHERRVDRRRRRAAAAGARPLGEAAPRSSSPI